MYKRQGAFGVLAVISIVIVKGAEAIFNVDLVSLVDNLRTISTVSYTHLDVYKRQAVIMAVLGWNFLKKQSVTV